MDWKKKYVRLLQNKHFDSVAVKCCFEKVFTLLNEELKRVEQEGVVFGENEVNLPDCRISYSVEPNRLTFYRHPKNGLTGITTSVYITFTADGYYKPSYYEQNYEELCFELIDDAIKNLLFPKKRH